MFFNPQRKVRGARNHANTKRYGQIIGLKPGAYEEYAQYHAKVWPGVLADLPRSNVLKLLRTSEMR
ncbi:MAG: L-rhamnose mutarotase [Terriglobia bacterium]